MKIVLIKREPVDIPDGIGIFIYSLAEKLLNQGHEVTVACGTYADPAKIQQCFQLDRYPALLSLGIPRDSTRARHAATWLLKGRSTVHQLNPDLIVVNGALPLRFLAPTCIVSHDLEKRFSPFGLLRVGYKRYAYRQADHLVATCTELKTALARELRIDPARIRVIPTCVNTNAYVKNPLSGRENAILHMGTADYKNPLATIQSFALVGVEGVRLYITGPTCPRVASCLVSLKPSIRKRVHLLGYLPARKLKEILSSVKVVAVPSNYFVPVASPTVLESFASGTPVVASPSITRDLLRDGLTGYIRRSDDFTGIAEAFERLLEDENVWGTMSCQALETVERFSTTRVAQSYLSLLEGS